MWRLLVFAVHQALALFYLGPDCQVGPARRELPSGVSTAAVAALTAGVEALLTHEVVLQRGIGSNRRAARSLVCICYAPCRT